MVKTLYETVEDAYNALKIAHDLFQKDKEYWGGNHHFEWESSVGMSGLIQWSKQYMKYGTYTPEQAPKTELQPTPSETAKKITVRLTDGSVKTKTEDVKLRIKEMGFWWNYDWVNDCQSKPPTYDWSKVMTQSDWDALKTQEPFNKLSAKIVE